MFSLWDVQKEGWYIFLKKIVVEIAIWLNFALVIDMAFLTQYTL